YGVQNMHDRWWDRLISVHGNFRSPAAISNAQFYRKTLGDRTREALSAAEGQKSLLQAQLETFLPPGVEATSFERIFHARNLNTILDRNLFASARLSSE